MSKANAKPRPLPKETRKMVAGLYGGVERYVALRDSIGYRQLRLIRNLLQVANDLAANYRRAHPLGRCRCPTCAIGNDAPDLDRDMVGVIWTTRQLAENLASSGIGGDDIEDTDTAANLRMLAAVAEGIEADAADEPAGPAVAKAR